MYKSYSARIGGNEGKVKYLEAILSDMKGLSKFLFDSLELFIDDRLVYRESCKNFPNLHTKNIDDFIKQYRDLIKSGNIPKHPIKESIILTQNFNVKKFEDNSVTPMWLQFHKKNFPLFSKRLSRLENFDWDHNVKTAQIFKRSNGKMYCRISVEYESENDNKKEFDLNNVAGLPLDANDMVRINNKIEELKKERNSSKKKNRNEKFKFEVNKFMHNLASEKVEDVLTSRKQRGLPEVLGVRSRDSRDILKEGNNHDLWTMLKSEKGLGKDKILSNLKHFSYDKFFKLMEEKFAQHGIAIKKKGDCIRIVDNTEEPLDKNSNIEQMSEEQNLNNTLLKFYDLIPLNMSREQYGKPKDVKDPTFVKNEDKLVFNQPIRHLFSKIGGLDMARLINSSIDKYVRPVFEIIRNFEYSYYNENIMDCSFLYNEIDPKDLKDFLYSEFGLAYALSVEFMNDNQVCRTKPKRENVKEYIDRVYERILTRYERANDTFSGKKGEEKQKYLKECYEQTKKRESMYFEYELKIAAKEYAEAAHLLTSEDLASGFLAI